MPDDTARGGDPLHMNQKGDTVHLAREEVGSITLFAVENESIYPKQSDEIARVVRATVESREKPKILLDLSGVRFVCSAFLGALTQLQNLARERAGEIKLCVTGEHVAYTMKLVRLNQLIDIGGDRRTMIDSFDPVWPTSR